MAQLKKRQVAKTGVEITELGIGSASMAALNVEVPDQQARDAITAALDGGVNYIDTAPQYGYGRAEHLVGDALRDRRKEAVLGTKVGRLLRPNVSGENRSNWVKPFPFTEDYSYTYDSIMRSYEDSLQRLGLATIDMLFVHDIGEMTHGKERNAYLWEGFTKGGGVRALQELKASGAVKALGFGVNEFKVLEDAMEVGDWDAFVLAGRYTLLEQTSLDFLAKCQQRGISIIAAAPFNGGALMGNKTWNYSAAPQHIVDRVRQLEQFCADHNIPIGAAALQFALTHPTVVSILVGPKSPAETNSNLAWWNVDIPASFWSDLAAAKLVAPGTPLPNGQTA